MPDNKQDLQPYMTGCCIPINHHNEIMNSLEYSKKEVEYYIFSSRSKESQKLERKFQLYLRSSFASRCQKVESIMLTNQFETYNLRITSKLNELFFSLFSFCYKCVNHPFFPTLWSNEITENRGSPFLILFSSWSNKKTTSFGRQNKEMCEILC